MIKRLFFNSTFISTIILINTVVLFFDAFDNLNKMIPMLYKIDLFINFIFIAEMIVKIKVLNWKRYISSDWNKMDFVINIILILVLISSASEINVLFITIFRTLRVIKIFKLFRYVPNIDHLLRSIKKALKTSIFIFYAFFVYLFVISFLSCLLFKHIEPDHFANPITSFYSCFRIITIEGWDVICETVAAHYSTFYSFLVKIYFMAMVLTGGLFGFSIVNAIFVDEMVADNNDALNNKIDILIKEVKSLKEQIK